MGGVKLAGRGASLTSRIAAKRGSTQLAKNLDTLAAGTAKGAKTKGTQRLFRETSRVAGETAASAGLEGARGQLDAGLEGGFAAADLLIPSAFRRAQNITRRLKGVTTAADTVKKAPLKPTEPPGATKTPKTGKTTTKTPEATQAALDLDIENIRGAARKDAAKISPQTDLPEPAIKPGKSGLTQTELDLPSARAAADELPNAADVKKELQSPTLRELYKPDFADQGVSEAIFKDASDLRKVRLTSAPESVQLRQDLLKSKNYKEALETLLVSGDGLPAGFNFKNFLKKAAKADFDEDTRRLSPEFEEALDDLGGFTLLQTCLLYTSPSPRDS